MPPSPFTRRKKTAPRAAPEVNTSRNTSSEKSPAPSGRGEREGVPRTLVRERERRVGAGGRRGKSPGPETVGEKALARWCEEAEGASVRSWRTAEKAGRRESSLTFFSAVIRAAGKVGRCQWALSHADAPLARIRRQATPPTFDHRGVHSVCHRPPALPLPIVSEPMSQPVVLFVLAGVGSEHVVDASGPTFFDRVRLPRKGRTVDASWCNQRYLYLSYRGFI